MSKKSAKFWVGFAAIALLTPVLSMAQSRNPGRGGHNGQGGNGGGNGQGNCDPYYQRCQAVPEGGSSAVYLLAVGATLLGAVALRSRMDRNLS